MKSASPIDYGALLKEIQPQVIETEEQNQEFIHLLEKLTSARHATPARSTSSAT